MNIFRGCIFEFYNYFIKKRLLINKDELFIENEFFNTAFFVFPSLLKKSIIINLNTVDWDRDYLSKEKNTEKYIFEVCEALQILGVSHNKYTRELKQYSNEILNKGTGEIVGRCFEIEARLTLRRSLELFLECWNFKNITKDKEETFRHFF